MFWYLGQDQDLGHTLKSSEWVCVYWPKSMNVRWLQKMKEIAPEFESHLVAKSEVSDVLQGTRLKKVA